MSALLERSEAMFLEPSEGTLASRVNRTLTEFDIILGNDWVKFR